MIRTSTALIVLVVGTSLTGCNDSMSTMGDRNGMSQEAVRFDQNGNKMYDPSVRNTRSEDMGRGSSDAMARSWDGGTSRDAWNTGSNNRPTNDQRAWNDGSRQGNWSNDQRNNQNDNRYTQDDRRSMRNDEQVWQNWNDSNVTTVRQSELPGPVLTTFQRRANGTELMETGWATHDGKKCYCSKAKKDGVTYKMISDADGNLIAMKRID